MGNRRAQRADIFLKVFNQDQSQNKTNTKYKHPCNMKPYLKAISFLVILTILDFLFRKGALAFFIPFKLPHTITILLLFTLFMLSSLLLTKWFCKKDKLSLNDLGISFDSKNRLEFLYGFLIGFALWAIVSMTQSYTAGFSWELRPNI